MHNNIHTFRINFPFHLYFLNNHIFFSQPHIISITTYNKQKQHTTNSTLEQPQNHKQQTTLQHTTNNL